MKLFLIFGMIWMTAHAVLTIKPDEWKALNTEMNPGFGPKVKVDVGAFTTLFAKISAEIPSQLTDFVNQANTSGETLLIKSAFKGIPAIYDILLDVKGINIDAQDNQGSTALMHASFWGRDNMVRKLCEKKANLNLQNKDGYTALMQAVSGGQSLNTVKILCENNADVNIKDKTGYTVLRLAVNAGKIPFIQELLKVKGIKVDELSGIGNDTALESAVSARRADIVKLLLENNANLDLEHQRLAGNPIAGTTTPYKTAENLVKALRAINMKEEEKQAQEVLDVLNEFKKAKTKASGSAGASASAGVEADEDKKRAEAEAEKKAQEEAERLKAEAEKADEDARKAREEEERKAAEAKKRADEEAKRKAEEDKKRAEAEKKAQEEAERKAAEAKRAEEEAAASASASAGAKDTGIEKLVEKLGKLKKLLGDLKGALGKIK